MPQRENWIDAARGVALSAVVLHHVLGHQLSSAAAAPDALTNVDLVLDGFRMPTLVALSGLLAASVGTWSWADVWRRRVAPLLLLYGAWAIVGTLAVAAFTDRASAASAAQRLAWIALRPDGWTWYLAALAIYLVLARALRRVPTVALVPLAAGVYLAAMYTWPASLVGSLDWWWYVAEHWVFFVCAERFARGYLRASARATGPLALLSIAVFAAAAGGAIALGIAHSPLVLGVLAASGTWLAICCSSAWGSAAWLGWARAIGRRSLGVYAIHSWLALVLWWNLRAYVPVFPFDGVVVPVSFTAALLGLSYGLTLAIDRWAPVPLLRPWWDTKSRERVRESTATAPAQ